MIFKLFNYLKNNNIPFFISNGYKEIVSIVNTESDIDIVLKKEHFKKIEKILIEFCEITDIKMVQVLNHDLWAKNIFLFNPKDAKYLNLDLYGELSRKDILFFPEKETFNTIQFYKDIPILSTEKEFISYLIKKLDKNEVSEKNFKYLHSLYVKEPLLCDKTLEIFFPQKYKIISDGFRKNNFNLLNKSKKKLVLDFSSLKKINITKVISNGLRIIKRIFYPTGINIAFLGSDGSGKSTIIDNILKNRFPFRRKDYFHLKPLIIKESPSKKEIISDPHKHPSYSQIKSYLKLLYFIYQYNMGWIKNISPLKIKSSLVIFDRYFDDILIDTKRYRYGGGLTIVKIARLFIPKPELYFILTADAKVIYERKQEVEFSELERQISAYRALGDNKQYFNIDVNRTPEEITEEITTIIMEKMNERY